MLGAIGIILVIVSLLIFFIADWFDKDRLALVGLAGLAVGVVICALAGG